MLIFSPLSALHLDVLQNLLVSSAIPDGLLRATGANIASLLAPQAGLGPVFQSSGFDADAVKAKLEAISVVVDTRMLASLGRMKGADQQHCYPPITSSHYDPTFRCFDVLNLHLLLGQLRLSKFFARLRCTRTWHLASRSSFRRSSARHSTCNTRTRCLRLPLSS